MNVSVSKRIMIISVGVVIFIGVTFAILSFIFFSTLSQPRDTFSVTAGSSVRQIAQEAASQNHIRSAWVFLGWYQLTHRDAPIQAGHYQLPQKMSVTNFIKILTTGEIAKESISITFPEGSTIVQMAEIITNSPATIDTEVYIGLLKGKEGYAFPDTYFITKNTTAEKLVRLQTETLTEMLISVQPAIQKHTLSESEIITLASILEREANSPESMKMVSGILQNRLAIDMPLQADASIEYVLDKPLSELTATDLKIDSPYNTYLYRGLPPTPISNPGNLAIEAVLEPTSSDYYYYITDLTGTFHYARTLDEHNTNVQRYLR
mgnify:CR=1 FL=1